MPENTMTPWKWHARSVDGDHNGAVYSEVREGHAYAVAMQPRYVTDEQFAADASLIVKAVNAHDALVATLERIVLLDRQPLINMPDKYIYSEIGELAITALSLAKAGS